MNEFVWAILTSAITGGACVAIWARGYLHRAAVRHQALTDALQRRLAALEAMEARLAEAEERLDFAERRLQQERDARRALPPTGPA